MQPLVWSSEGRAHPEVERVMSFCAVSLARRSGSKVADVLRRWRTDVGVILAARRARMARRCLPRWSAQEAYVAHGIVGEEVGGNAEAGGMPGAYAAGNDDHKALDGQACDEEGALPAVARAAGT